MDGMADNVKARYTDDAGSNVADRVRALPETLGLGGPSRHLAERYGCHVVRC